MNRQFQENNEILTAIAKANNIFSNEFDHKVLLPLPQSVVTVPSEVEFSVARNYSVEKQNKTVL